MYLHPPDHLLQAYASVLVDLNTIYAVCCLLVVHAFTLFCGVVEDGGGWLQLLCGDSAPAHFLFAQGLG